MQAREASPCLFSLSTDNCLYDLKEYERRLRMGKLSVKYLYADDQVILALSAYELQEMVTKVNVSVKKRDRRVNVSKTKLMMLKKKRNDD
ncbi:hypothetical protein EVAR_83044_1 [Eumeta japonica]|uniref:Reverse transcriptase domain-containing protein n=1 Tax=Eumeta variegata TaxID=151549 RepID=A0A4C1VLE3_EUMVA|nr:hypothetical protein EVAR_83044_1 [Eumeta japonica]